MSYQKMREELTRKMSGEVPQDPCVACGRAASVLIEAKRYCPACNPLRVSKGPPSDASSDAVRRMAEIKSKLSGKV